MKTTRGAKPTSCASAVVPLSSCAAKTNHHAAPIIVASSAAHSNKHAKREAIAAPSSKRHAPLASREPSIKRGREANRPANSTHVALPVPRETLGQPITSAEPKREAADRSPSSTRGEETTQGAQSIDIASPASVFDELRLLAEVFWDTQKHRIATSNRIHSGQVRPELSEAVLAHLNAVELSVGLAMRRCFRRASPELYEWAKETKGIGEHCVARLLGCIGHPVQAYPMRWVTGKKPKGHVCIPKRCGKSKKTGEPRHLVAGEPFARTVSQLWTYCGHGEALKKEKGMSQDDALGLGNSRAKMLVHLMAECTMKCMASPYRVVYDMARIKYQDREEWKDAHKHNAALRKVGKEILKDIWLVARGTIPAADPQHDSSSVSPADSRVVVG